MASDKLQNAGFRHSKLLLIVAVLLVRSYDKNMRSNDICRELTGLDISEFLVCSEKGCALRRGSLNRVINS